MATRLFVIAVMLGAFVGCGSSTPTTPEVKDPDAAKRTSDRAKMINDSSKQK